MSPKIIWIITLIFILAMNGTGQDKQVDTRSQKKKVVVTGFVTDSLQNPVTGAAIFIDGKKTGKYTDKMGFYSIKVKPGSRAILVFSGQHGGQEISYTGQESINFVLSETYMPEPGSTIIQDQPRHARNPAQAAQDDQTSSVSRLNGNKLENHNYRTIYDMIEGEVPGVFVQGSSIVIRGPSSVNASSEALLVVDGTVVPSISYINPKDVKSISILKGSAAAIYGSRGSNGVVVITLKGNN